MAKFLHETELKSTNRFSSYSVFCHIPNIPYRLQLSFLTRGLRSWKALSRYRVRVVLSAYENITKCFLRSMCYKTSPMKGARQI